MFPAVDARLIVGEFVGRLDNGGEQIKIDDADGSTIVQFTYQDQHPWPAAADGQGASLQLPDPSVGARRSSGVACGRSDARQSARCLGDLNQDRRVDTADIARLCRALDEADGAFDLDGDRTVDTDDVVFYIRYGFGTQIGDANLDRRFDSGDFVHVFQVGEYEDAIAGNSTWSEGDWNCDGDFSTADLVFALQVGGFVAAAIPLDF